MNINLLQLECLTNMHVGSGDVSYSIVDNQVEKDPVLGTPVIHASGVKGALKEYFNKNGFSKIDEIFGSVRKEKNETTPGTYKFLNANLLVRPLRVSDGKVFYIRTTSPEILNTMAGLLRNMGITKIMNCEVPQSDLPEFSENKVYVSNQELVSEVEGYQTVPDGISDVWLTFLNEVIGGPFAVMNTALFQQQDLPVIARNALNDKGISINLWYEEVVPHKSSFYLLVLSQEEIPEFMENVDGKVIQFGGNASIGYGLTKVRELSIDMKEQG